MAAITVREGIHLGGAVALGGVILAAWCLGGFASALAVAEPEITRILVVAGALRIGLAFLVLLLVAVGTDRERRSGTLALVLALALPRWRHYLGRWCGWSLLALALLLAGGIPIFLLDPSARALLWIACLGMELLLLVAITLFLATGGRHLSITVLAALALYLLSRTLSAVLLLAQEASPPLAPALRGFLESLAVLLPALDRYAQGGWLLPGGPPAEPAQLLPLLAHALTHLLIFLAAGLWVAEHRAVD